MLPRQTDAVTAVVVVGRGSVLGKLQNVRCVEMERPVTPLLIDFHEKGDTEMKMRVMLMLSMGAFLLSTTQANAGLLDLFGHDSGCCKPRVKKCCKPVVRKCCNSRSNCCDSGSGLLNVFKIFDRSSDCCNPAPKCCKPKPVCCKPRPKCCGSGSGKVAPKAPPYEDTPAPPEESAPTPKKAA